MGIAFDRLQTRSEFSRIPIGTVGVAALMAHLLPISPTGEEALGAPYGPVASGDIERASGGVGLSHRGIIAEGRLNARLFFCFFLLHKSLSINDLRRGGGASSVTR